jgi:sentrin-specific protease 1
LPAQAEAEVQAIFRNPSFISKVGREQVTHKDIQRLLPGKWLNDELINFYGQLIVERSLNYEVQKENIDINDAGPKHNVRTPLRLHFFNTFFWPKLQQGYVKSNLKKWTKKVYSFESCFCDH